jgi:hypothetical protein
MVQGFYEWKKQGAAMKQVHGWQQPVGGCSSARTGSMWVPAPGRSLWHCVAVWQMPGRACCHGDNS